MNASEVSVGLAHEVMIRMASAGAEVSDLTILSKDEGICRKLIALIRGTAEILTKKFLTLVNGDITIPALKKPFIVSDHFIVDTSDKAKVKIYDLGTNFRDWFLGTKVKSRDGYKMSSHRLTKNMSDKEIQAELGKDYDTDLAAIFSLMEKQPHGKEGILLNNSYANIFYVKNNAGGLCAVFVRWHGGGWSVDADSVAGTVEWGGGCQVFSRNS